jgi:enamine deaminase RidA (YjgF/YER057c/UK114 family)
MCNLFDLPGTGFQDDLGHKLDVLRAHCEAEGRDYGDIVKTTSTILDFGDDGDLAGAVDRFSDHVHGLAAIGIDQVIAAPHGPWTEACLAALAAAVPEIEAVPTRRP